MSYEDKRIFPKLTYEYIINRFNDYGIQNETVVEWVQYAKTKLEEANSKDETL
jgi:hypothetical protein